MTSPSHMDNRLTVLGPPTTAPQCDECLVALEPTGRSVLLPALRENLVFLRCPRCKQESYWQPQPAYVPVAQDVEWVR